jgi:hypothetical protein
MQHAAISGLCMLTLSKEKTCGDSIVICNNLDNNYYGNLLYALILYRR